uniref:Uncharacterized protein n=1 Tax=Aegilops tauschii subsp. strangulata TaxID=200361 RepID=A0A453FU33_AEGTS
MHKTSNPCQRPFRYILESNSFELFFEYVELPNFDIASDALNTFKDLLTKHETVVSVYLSSHYEQFFERYTRILTSTNYVTRRQSVKFLSEFLLEPSNSKIMKRYIQEVRFLNIMIGLLKVSVIVYTLPFIWELRDYEIAYVGYSVLCFLLSLYLNASLI